MPLLGLWALTALGAGLALFAPLELGFGAVLAFWMLVPAGIILPGLVHILLIDRIVLVAFIIRLVMRSGQPGEAAPSAFRPTPLHAAWGALLVAGYVDGVVLSSGQVHDNLVDWLTVVDSFLLLTVALAVFRTIGLHRILRPLTVVVTIAAGIGIIERITGHGWAHYLVEHVPAAYGSTFVFGLGTRGGAVRSQAASEFALEFGWVLVMVLPFIAVGIGLWMARNRQWGRARNLFLLIPVVALIALVLTASRSAEVGVAAGAVLLVVFAGFPKRLTAAVLGAVAGILVVGLAAPSWLGSPFTSAESGSISSRTGRLPEVFSLVVHHTWSGLGYTGLHSLIIGADDAYALTYSQLGVVGLLAWGVVLVTTLATACRALRNPRGTLSRQMAAACTVAAIAVIVASAGYDLTFTEQSMWALALIGAGAAAMSEQVVPRARVIHRSWARLSVPVMGVLAGFAAFHLAPLNWSRNYVLYFITPKQLATGTGVNGLVSHQLADTVCGYLAIPQLQRAGTTVHCAEPSVTELYVYEPEVTVRIGGTSARAVQAEAKLAFAAFRALRYPAVYAVGPVQSGKPAWATTAPLSGGVLGAMVAFIVPPIPLRRRQTVAIQPALSPAGGAPA